jgi:hypothetical protein
MKAKCGDSIAKAEQKMVDLRPSKRQSNITRRRTKLREQVLTSPLIFDPVREI